MVKKRWPKTRPVGLDRGTNDRMSGEQAWQRGSKPDRGQREAFQTREALNMALNMYLMCTLNMYLKYVP